MNFSFSSDYHRFKMADFTFWNFVSDFARSDLPPNSCFLPARLPFEQEFLGDTLPPGEYSLEELTLVEAYSKVREFRLHFRPFQTKESFSLIRFYVKTWEELHDATRHLFKGYKHLFVNLLIDLRVRYSVDKPIVPDAILWLDFCIKVYSREICSSDRSLPSGRQTFEHNFEKLTYVTGVRASLKTPIFLA